MQVRDVMSAHVVAVGPYASAKKAGEVMARRGFAALPVVDVDNRLIGIVGEADVLRGRIPADPRLHLRRQSDETDVDHPLRVRDVMTAAVRAVDAATDVSDVARLLVDGHLRSVPVMDDEILVGIVSRRDVLMVLGRPDSDIRADALELVESYTGDPGCWDVQVTDGVTAVRRTRGAPGVSPAVEEFAVGQLLRTVAGVVTVHLFTGSSAAAQHIAEPVEDGGPGR